MQGEVKMHFLKSWGLALFTPKNFGRPNEHIMVQLKDTPLKVYSVDAPSST